MKVQMHQDFAVLFEPHRNKIGFGGRGGMKSYGFADALLISGAKQFERVLCAREEMDSIRESVHHLLEQRIYALGLQDRYQILQSIIYGPEWEEGKTEFIFAGLRHNVRKIKSLEGVTKVWVEEAQSVSKDSWQTLIPTIRWDNKKPVGHPERRDSEIWVTFNPELATDDTYVRWVLKPPPDTVHIKSTYLDNPWLPETLRIEAEYMREVDPLGYSHVWLGECKSEIEGAIFSEQLKVARKEERITTVPMDRTRPVFTFWDLGYGDKTAIWFAQAIDGWYQIIDYHEDSGKTIADYVVALNQRGYLYGAHWLPHDCVNTIIHKSLAGGDRTRSVEQLLRAACGSVPIRVAAMMTVTDRVNAARTIFSQCRFDADKCADGLQALSHYQWAPMNKNGATPRQELHNWASHGSSAFCTLAVSIKQPIVQRPAPREPDGEYSWQG